MPDITEEFLKELMGGQKIHETLAGIQEGFNTKLLELSNAITALQGTSNPENIPAKPPTIPTPPIPENPVPPLPGTPEKKTLTFRRHGRGLRLIEEKEQKPTNQTENKNADSGGQKTA